MSKPSGGVSRYDFNASPSWVFQTEQRTAPLVAHADQQRPFVTATSRAQGVVLWTQRDCPTPPDAMAHGSR
jgi:hypothetical protein